MGNKETKIHEQMLTVLESETTRTSHNKDFSKTCSPICLCSQSVKFVSLNSTDVSQVKLLCSFLSFIAACFRLPDFPLKAALLGSLEGSSPTTPSHRK